MLSRSYLFAAGVLLAVLPQFLCAADTGGAILRSQGHVLLLSLA
jgi:hypothetical protein